MASIARGASVVDAHTHAKWSANLAGIECNNSPFDLDACCVFNCLHWIACCLMMRADDDMCHISVDMVRLCELFGFDLVMCSLCVTIMHSEHYIKSI